MSKKRLFSVLALCAVSSVTVAAISGCHAEAKFGNPEPKAAPPPPPPAPPPPAPAPAPVTLASKPVFKAIGKAKIVNNEIQIPGKIQFDLDKSTIKETPETQDVLNTLANVMKENPQITKVRVEGHTDDKGALDHNNKLSQERADSVATWLAGKGVDKSRVATIGFGPSKPLVANDSEPHREQNRRTEFKIWEVDGKPTDAAKADASSTPATGSTAAAPAASGTAATKTAAPAGTGTTATPTSATTAPKK
ncbi:Outer membrane protein [Labilithrix luteola]|uniref:Outer membrane protein n=1 Tax=Labilithrix luteola TaxID=1391654 RepID=A0A0K1Q918_9BACT|nr:OmpA family protein [Labilithrix luteola]AKV02177.1 Outer membrane protein [Labilithrix luteola]